MNTTNNHLELIDIRYESKNPHNWYVTGEVDRNEIDNWFMDMQLALDFIENELK